MEGIRLYISCYRLLFIVLSSLLVQVCNAQNLELDFNSKDYQEYEQLLIDRLDPNRNYIIAFTAFWCSPCIRNINNIYKNNIEKYREEFNLDIVLIDDDYFHNVARGLERIKNNQWYFPMYFIEERFINLGVSAIPTYFFKPARSNTAFKLIQSGFEDAVEKYYSDKHLESIFLNEMEQTLVSDLCHTEKFLTNSLNDTLINNLKHYKIGNHYYRNGVQSKSFYRYNLQKDKSEIIFDMTLDKCDQFVLKDIEGDSITFTVELVENENGHIIIHTDKVIKSTCGNPDIPFVLSSEYGSSAGIHFNINNGELTTVLACHKSNDLMTYLANGLDLYCNPNTTIDYSSIDVNIYPNPTNSIIYIKNQSFSRFTLFNLYRAPIKSGALSESQAIDLSDLQEGTYLLRLMKDNRSYYFFKVVKI